MYKDYNFIDIDDNVAKFEKAADFYANMIFLGHSENEIAFIVNRTKEHLELYDFIRCRDSYICQRCSKTQEEELIDLGWRLSVHHIDGDHNNNDVGNMITYCSLCHKIVETKMKKLIRLAKEDAEYLEIACSV